jgi:hypothetical protein
MRSGPRLYPAIPILSLREHCLIPGVVNTVSAAERTARCLPKQKEALPPVSRHVNIVRSRNRVPHDLALFLPSCQEPTAQASLQLRARRLCYRIWLSCSNAKPQAPARSVRHQRGRAVRNFETNPAAKNHHALQRVTDALDAARGGHPSLVPLSPTAL